MVNIDTVYQRVLVFANKEQRGYITPQEFNLFANQAQSDIFEQYFYDINIARKGQGNDTVYADIDDILEQKLQIFEEVDGQGAINAYDNAGGGGINKVLPDYVYRVTRVEYNNIECEILSTKDFKNVQSAGYLVAPSVMRPIVNIRNNQIRCVAGINNKVTPTGIFYFRIPTPVRWGYIVMNKQAMYDNTKSTNFELHVSEQVQLVNKILRLAGISIKQTDITQAGQGMDMVTLQQQPKI